MTQRLDVLEDGRPALRVACRRVCVCETLQTGMTHFLSLLCIKAPVSER